MPQTSVLETVLHSTLTKSRGDLIMASMKANALHAWVFSNDRVKYENGGHEISNPLIVGRNPNVGSYSYYDQLPVAQTNEFDTVKYGWSRIAGTVIISDQEEDENQGDSQIFKLITAKVEVLKDSITEKFTGYLYGVGAGTDPLGLEALIPDDPTVGTLGGLSRQTESQWRTSMYDYDGALDHTNIEEAFDDILLDLTQKSERPSVAVCGRNFIRDYRAAVRAKTFINLDQGTNADKRMYDLGFQGTKHGNVTMLFDEDCDPDKCYFINDKYLKLHVLKHVNMKVKELSAPWNMDAKGRRIVWQGQWCLWRAYRTHAVVMN